MPVELTDAEVFAPAPAAKELSDAEVFAPKELSDTDVFGAAPKPEPKPVGTMEGLWNSLRAGVNRMQSMPETLLLALTSDDDKPTIRKEYTAYRRAMEDPRFGQALLDASQDQDQQRKAASLFGPEAKLDRMMFQQRQSQAALAGDVARAETEISEIPRSEPMKELAQARTAGEKFAVWARDPVEITSSFILESLPPSVAGAVLGAPGGPAGVAAGVGASSGLSTFASELLGNSGVDVRDPEALLKWVNSDKFDEDFQKAATKAPVIATIDAATAGAAGQFVKPALKEGFKALALSTAKELGLQAAGGAGGEALGSVLSGQPIDTFDVAMEALAEIGSGPVEVSLNLITDAKRAEANHLPATAEVLRENADKLKTETLKSEPVAEGTPGLPLAEPSEISISKEEEATQNAEKLKVEKLKPADAPVPETAEAIAKQLEVTLDPASGKAVTLITPGTPTPNVSGLESVRVGAHGTAYFNPAKTTREAVLAAAEGKDFDGTLLGMSQSAKPEPVGNTVVQTVKDGVPVLDEVVAPTPEAIAQATEAHKAAVPGGETSVRVAEEVLREREQLPNVELPSTKPDAPQPTTPAAAETPAPAGTLEDEGSVGDRGTDAVPDGIPAESAEVGLAETAPTVTTPTQTKPTNTAKAKVIADKLRAQFKTETSGHVFTGPVQIINAAVELGARIIEQGGKVADAIAAAVKYIRENYTGEFNEADFVKRWRDAITEQIAPGATQPGNKRSQVFGRKEIGHEYSPESRRTAREWIKLEIFDGDQPVSDATTAEAQIFLDEWTSKERGGATGDRIRQAGDSTLSYGIAQQELFSYALKLAAAGKPAMLTRLVQEINQMATPGIDTISEAGRALSGRSDFEHPLWKAYKEVAAERDRIVTETVGDEATVEAVKKAVSEAKPENRVEAMEEALKLSVPWQKKKRDNPVKAKTDLAKIRKAVEAELTNPEIEWETALAEENGWSGFSDEQHRRLAELNAILDDPNTDPHQAVKATNEIMDIVRRVKMPSKTMYAIAEGFAASMFSGLPTVNVNLFAPPLLLLRNLFTELVTNPLNFPSAVKQFGEALNGFNPEFTWSWLNDSYAMHTAEYLRQSGALKQMMEGGLKDMQAGRKVTGAAKVFYGAQQFVFRTLSSLDQAWRTVEREYKTALLTSKALQAAGYSRAEIARLSDGVIALKRLAYEQAVADGMSEGDARVRSHDTVIDAWWDALSEKTEGGQSTGVAETAQREADLLAGLKSDNIKETEEGMLSRPINKFMEYFSSGMMDENPFVRIGTRMMFGVVNVPFRTLRFGANFSPYGLVRYAVHRSRTGRGKETLWKQSFGSELQARERLNEAMAGTALMLLLPALTSQTADDDDKNKFGVFFTGKGPDASDKIVRDAWLKKYRPYSITVKMGDNYGVLPLSRGGESVLWATALAGALDDYHWKAKHTAGTRQPKDLEPVAEVAGAYFQSMSQRGIFSTFARLGEIGSARSGKPLAQAAAAVAYSAGPLVPYKGAMDTFTRILTDPVDRSSISGALLANTPVAGGIAGKPALNALGDPIDDRSLFGKVIREGAPIAINLKDAKSPAYDLILKFGQGPTTPNRSQTEAIYGALSNEQWHELVRKSGKAVKEYMELHHDDLSGMDAADFNEDLTKASTEARQEAADEMGLEARTAR